MNKKTPWTQTVDLDPPSLENNTGDVDRLAAALKKKLGADAIDIGLPVLRALPRRLREWGYKIKCVLVRDRGRWLVAGIKAADDPSPTAGIAIDLGTTMISMRLVEIETVEIEKVEIGKKEIKKKEIGKKKAIAEISFENPQRAVGPDILTRIHFAAKNENLKKINGMLVDGLNKKIQELCESAGIQTDGVFMLTVAGNTAMTQLFMGLNPRWSIREPYIPVVNRPGIVSAAELGIRVNESARCLIFPNVGSYFGGDLIAGILFSGLHKKEETCLLVDIGTNAEVVLGNRNWLMACAGAAGPALEGGVTQMGMAAAPGVIDRVVINADDDEIAIHTIGDLPPLGICGSGLIDLVAGLFLTRRIDIQGKFEPEKCGPRLKEADGIKRFVLVFPKDSETGFELFITQADIDSLIRSKAAMHTILETIAAAVGILFSDIETFFIAGSFGIFIHPRSAISIGMMPDLPVEKYKTMGNSSLGGAVMALESCDVFDEIDAIKERITYMELNVNQDFMNRFSASRFLPHTDAARFPSVKR